MSYSLHRVNETQLLWFLAHRPCYCYAVNTGLRLKNQFNPRDSFYFASFKDRFKIWQYLNSHKHTCLQQRIIFRFCQITHITASLHFIRNTSFKKKLKSSLSEFSHITPGFSAAQIHVFLHYRLTSLQCEDNKSAILIYIFLFRACPEWVRSFLQNAILI